MRNLWPFKVLEKIGQLEKGDATWHQTCGNVQTLYGCDTWIVWMPHGINERMTHGSMTYGKYGVDMVGTIVMWHVDKEDHSAS